MADINISIKSKSITAYEFNELVAFFTTWSLFFGEANVEANLPLFLNGKTSSLSKNAKEIYNIWRKEGKIQNMRVIK